MKKAIKRYFGLGIVLFVLFLLIHYWESIESIGQVILYAITPLLGGIVIAYIVNIPMSFYENYLFGRFKNKVMVTIKRPLCMLLSFVTVGIIIFAVVFLILPELSECINIIIKVVPPYIRKTYLELEAKYELSSFISQSVLSQFEDIKDVTDVVSKIIEWFFNGFGNVVGSVFSIVTAVFTTVFSVFMSFVFAVYLLLGKEMLFSGINKTTKAYLNEKKVDGLANVVHIADESFHSFIVGQCTEAIILGVLCIIGMSIFGFPYATMIGTLIGFTALIPIAGAYIGAAIGAVMILTAGSWVEALLFVVFIIILQQFEGNLIYPKVVGASIGLPGIWVLAVITVSGSLGGIPAMLVGVPVFATVYRIVKGNVNNRLNKADERLLEQDAEISEQNGITNNVNGENCADEANIQE